MLHVNYTEYLCIKNPQHQLPKSLKLLSSYCNATWDTASCWPETLSNHTAFVPCPYATPESESNPNATRFCYANGTWASKSNYEACLTDMKLPEDRYFTVNNLILQSGFGVSTIALALALGILCYFRNLRCLRNNIHCNLILSFILRNAIWFGMRHSMVDINRQQKNMWLCETLAISYHYFQSTNFFWMFVEGLYLHMILVWTYSADKLRFIHFLLIGWGLPIPFIVAWTVIVMRLENRRCLLHDSPFDYIRHVPIFIVLLANVIFFISIIWILITKLRMTHTPEAMDYRKAVKAAVVLLPLLGVTYTIFILRPTGESTFEIFIIYFDTALQAFQGFLVAIFYCFLNGEVRQTLRSKWCCCSSNNNSRHTTTRCSRISSMSMHKQSMTVNFAMQQELLSDQKLNGTKDFISMSDSGNERLTVVEDEESHSFVDTKL